MLLISSHDTFASRVRNVEAPPRVIEHTAGVINVDSLRGKKVSVTFWSSNDAASRVENLTYAAEARRDSTRRVHIGVNIDDEPQLFKEYLLHDNLSNDANQLLATGDVAARLAETYGYGTRIY